MASFTPIDCRICRKTHKKQESYFFPIWSNIFLSFLATDAVICSTSPLGLDPHLHAYLFRRSWPPMIGQWLEKIQRKGRSLVFSKFYGFLLLVGCLPSAFLCSTTIGHLLSWPAANLSTRNHHPCPSSARPRKEEEKKRKREEKERKEKKKERERRDLSLVSLF